MSIKGQACIAGIFEHPTRKAPDKSTAQLHAEVAMGAVADAGLRLSDIDGYFCAGDAPGTGPISMVDYLNLNVRHVDSTDTGGAAYIQHVSHAAQAIAAGKCDIALVTLAGRPRSEGASASAPQDPRVPDVQWEEPYGAMTAAMYAMAARRHMHIYGTTPEDLAWVKVAASHHAQHNPNAMLKKVVTVEDVVTSPMVANPLHRLDCCVVSDGGGAVIVTRPEIARSLNKPIVSVAGAAETVMGQAGGDIELTWTGAVRTAQQALEEAGVSIKDIRYASLYDSFTITVIMQLESLGFCAPGTGGKFVSNGRLISGVGKLAVNTDGGGLCNNHPAFRGGMTKIIEAVRQLRGEAHPAVQVPDLPLAMVHGTGWLLGSRHSSATLILERQ